MAKLTKRIVDTTQATDHQSFVWDDGLKGFGLRITPSGTKAFVLQYRTATGRSRRMTIGRYGPLTVEAAREKALRLLAAVVDGEDPVERKAEARKALTVEELARLYLAEGPAEKPNKKASSWATDRSNIERHIIPLLGRKLAKSLTKADVARFQADVAVGKTAADVKTRPRGRAIVEGGRGTANRSLAVLAAMLAFGKDRGIVQDNPAPGVRPFKTKPQERFLTDHEVVVLAEALAIMEAEAAINPTMATAIRLLMLTGARKSEILGARWEWVDFDHGYLRLPDSKTGPKRIALPAAALQILAGIQRVSPYVLPAAKGEGHVIGLQKSWEALRVRATELARQRAAEDGEAADRAPDLTGVRLHDLRHSFASFAVADGATLYMVGKVLGHKQSRTTVVYAHLHDDPLRAVAERTASRIAGAMRAGAERGKSGEVVPLRPGRAR